ncbi:MAG: histidine kinase [Anaerolineales bacterium]|jgi:signal transduction histidine kinase|nr:histidine kinase [Anaerolineales bacterium]
MYKSDSPFVADWFVISLRWLVLLGVIVSLSISDGLKSWGNSVLGLLVLWNILLTWLAGLNRRLPNHRIISVMIDLTVSALFFFLQGGISGPAAWIGVLPILSAALYFDLRGALLTSLAIIILHTIDAFLAGLGWFWYVFPSLEALAVGVFFGYISQQMIRQLRLMRIKQIEDRERQQHIQTDRMQAIYKLSSTLTATLSYKRVLDMALEISTSALHVDNFEQDTTPKDDRLISCVLLFDGQELVVGSARRLPQADLRMTFPAKNGLLHRVVEDGENVVTSGVQNDPELKRLIGLNNCESIYCLSLRTGFNVYGVLLFGHPDPNYFSTDRCEVLDIIGRQATIAIQNARLYQDLADEKERMAEAQEEARKKLARDLHDGPTQSVAAIAMRVNLARRMLERNQGDAVEELVKIEDLARRTTKEIRHMLFTLRPLVLESQGLNAALEQMAEKMKETFGQQVVVQVDEKLADDIEMGKKGIIFYLAEEAVNNARKHAQSPNIYVRLRTVKNESEIAWLQIADEGQGFDVEAITKSYDKRGSLGMVNLRERTELVNGLLHIDSAPGKGTRVNVYIPLSEEAADKLHHGRIQG